MRARAAFFSDSARLYSSSKHSFFSLRGKRPILCSGCSADGSFHHTPVVCEGHRGDVVVGRKRFPERCRIPLCHTSTLQPVQVEPWSGLTPLVVNHGEFLAQLYHDQEMVRVDVCATIRFNVDNIREVTSVNQNVVDLELPLGCLQV